MGARVVFHLADVAIASPWAFMDVIELCPMWLLEMEERRFVHMRITGVWLSVVTRIMSASIYGVGIEVRNP